jgi:hypothetical protein
MDSSYPTLPGMAFYYINIACTMLQMGAHTETFIKTNRLKAMVISSEPTYGIN